MGVALDTASSGGYSVTGLNNSKFNVVDFAQVKEELCTNLVK